MPKTKNTVSPVNPVAPVEEFDIHAYLVTPQEGDSPAKLSLRKAIANLRVAEDAQSLADSNHKNAYATQLDALKYHIDNFNK